MINYNKLMNNLETLKLDKMVCFLPNYLESIKNQDISIVDILYRLTEEEIKYRDERASKIQVSVAGFPFEKEIKDFDFSYQPGINKQQLLDLESLRFMENKENVLFVGSSGVGKTHLAISLGIAAAKKRYLTYFISCTPINLRGRELIFEEPTEPVKNRTYGVVAVCCYLWNKGYKVRLLTNSCEIERLANKQGIKELSVVKIS